MRQLRFAVVLPILQFLTAGGLLEWGHRVPPPKGLDTLYMPTVTLICFGINAPAVLFKSPWYVLPRTSLSILGFGAEELSFLLGVVLVWYLLGRELDQRESQKALLPVTALSFFFNILLIVFGMVLFLLGLAAIFRHPGGNSSGGIIAGTLFLIWSLAIDGRCGARLMSGLRHRRSALTNAQNSR